MYRTILIHLQFVFLHLMEENVLMNADRYIYVCTKLHVLVGNYHTYITMEACIHSCHNIMLALNG